ncbi:alpha/beta hydrolase [Phaeobacter gallaeciensis]|uniref:alpha/beta fold hydrolase n=1 Tax=Phaeobacter gallaeciensis TaxID=60890 RepID=UPI00237F6978|nr:alpha/beta hydrolase [Phaeobacter gallaeciensis]MDE4304153.1 alpha/beta hydrolase [Phaeobacter gallaeciensis]MDE4308504.1 alpha/beta hydrolase [Phaeobacter gallaeciensis]MDE4312961.1 alpha/beta hydrolase [Phaeobacter gallaeciensis]MDE4317084.1 alpha/beta hydrolase [Phaeobacter gallaeciensis]MDE4321547.1 alpha/beta hydrolase [Phaeobacter gallaeciensis]
MASEIETGRAEVNGQTIAYTQQGSGPAVLLLHGFPQTRAMWDAVAPRLAEQFTVVTADLRGYGDSSKPGDMTAMSFREMGADQVALMHSLGHESFHLVGHDRGARTAHRMALDSPEAVASLTVMDIIPTHLLLGDLHQEVARAYYHWFFLAQPAPFPERMIGADPDYYFESCLLGWGGATLEDFPAEALEAYRKSWRDPACIHAMCNDYRAAIDVDFALDAADLDRQVSCPALVLYGATGAMAKQYDVEATWAPRLANMRAAAIPGGHFFVDQHPSETAEALLDFLSEQPAF